MEQNDKPSSKRGIYILVTIVALLLAGVAVYALQNSKTDTENSDPSKTGTTVVTPDTKVAVPDTSTQAAPAPSERMVIEFTDNGITPNKVSVNVGTTVTVTNKSSKKVQFSSDDHPVHKDNQEMNLKTLNPGESDTYTATKIGTWGFHDHIDERKTGTVTVTE